MNTFVVAVSLPNLPIARARRAHPSIHCEPLVLVSSQEADAIVYIVANETGLAPGISLQRAKVRCSHAIYRQAESASDQQEVLALLAAVQIFCRRVVLADPLPDLLILADTEARLRPDVQRQLRQIRRALVTTFQLQPALGAATNPLVATIAARNAKPGETFLVTTGEEAAFLAPLPITVLSLPEDVQERLRTFGIRTVGALAALPLDALQAQYGALGRTMYGWARGVDETPLPAMPEPPAITSRWRFNGAITARPALDAALRRLAAAVARKLDATGTAARELRLTLDLEHGDALVQMVMLAQPTAVAATLEHACRALIDRAAIGSGIEQVQIAVTETATTQVQQLDLFAPEHGRDADLKDTLARLAPRFGHSFFQAELVTPRPHRVAERVRLKPLDPS
jgi:DNA polymerase IV